MMSNRRDYEIAFVGLKPGLHEFSYEINDMFFDDFGEQDFSGTKATIRLLLEKNTSFLRLRFEVGGKTDVNCDRCNNELPIQLFDEFTITVKMIDNPEVMNDQEEDPDVFYISRGESHLYVKDWLYEFVSLSIPMQRTCEYENMDGPHCNPAAREILDKMRPGEEKKGDMWKGLEKFRGMDE